MITAVFKDKIVQAIKEDKANYPSYAKQAVSLDVSSAQLSRIINGDTEQVLSDAKWMSIGRRLNVSLLDTPKWNIAKTKTFIYIYEQLSYCQNLCVSGLFCDIPDIGKTVTARQYVKENKKAVYVDCSQVKTKQKLIRTISKELGLIHTGRYADVYADLVYYLLANPNILVILDEAGDLEYSAFLELKALWNATEGATAWYMLGADALRIKIESNITRNKVGYAEIFSRFGSDYQRTSENGGEALQEFKKQQFAMVLKANIPHEQFQTLYPKLNGSLRKLFTHAKKEKA
jgi:DNA transposition AAA+ family ATPase